MRHIVPHIFLAFHAYLQIQSAMKRGLEDNSSMSDISVMVYYTIPFKNIVTDPILYIEHLIDGANQIFRNNDLPLRLSQFCIEELDVEEGPTAESRLHGFLYAKSNSTAVNETLAALSILGTTDIAILMTATAVEEPYTMGMFASTGGAAFTGPTPVERNPPLAWVSAGAKQGNKDPINLFAHEVAHLLGCDHNREEYNGGLSNTTHYGYLVKGTNYRTIMAYDTHEQNNVRIPFFSSKDITYDGLKIGDAQNDNRRTLRQNRFLISQIGDESGNCSTTITSCAGKCLSGNLGPTNLTLDEKEIWCRNHCNMPSTGYFNLLGKPVGFGDGGKMVRTVIFYCTLSLMVILASIYIVELRISCCSSERKQYNKIKESPFASANILAVLGVFLNAGFMVLVLILNGGPQDYVGVSAWLTAAVVDGMLLCAIRDVLQCHV